MAVDEKYLELVEDVLENGRPHGDRTGVGTRRVFGRNLRIDLGEGFPLLTTKAVWFKGVFEELMWFLRGETNVKGLVDRGVSIWTPNAYQRYKRRMKGSGVEPVDQDQFEEVIRERDANALGTLGQLGPIYGEQWRDFGGTDQIKRLIRGLRENPGSRRHVVSAWNAGELDRMEIPPCHVLFQCFVENGKLSLRWCQRSCDLMLGGPWNIASYALLTHILAQQAGLEVGEVLFNGGDVHIYDNHLEQAREQINREPRRLPKIELPDSPPEEPENYEFEDVNIRGYDPHPPIKLDIAV